MKYENVFQELAKWYHPVNQKKREVYNLIIEQAIDIEVDKAIQQVFALVARGDREEFLDAAEAMNLQAEQRILRTRVQYIIKGLENEE